MPSILPSTKPAVNAGPTSVRPDNPPDPPDVAAFRELSDARRRHDHKAARPLYVALRALGWQIVPCEVKAGKVRS